VVVARTGLVGAYFLIYCFGGVFYVIRYWGVRGVSSFKLDYKKNRSLECN